MLERWQKIIDNAQGGAKAAADAMAEYIRWRTAEITLRRTLHPPGAYNQAKGGEPPAYASGNLARNMFAQPSSSGVRSTALVGNHAPYSRITEFGCVVTAQSVEKLSWADSAGKWYHFSLVHPAHPFIEPTTREAIDDGSLQEAAVEAFRPYDP